MTLKLCFENEIHRCSDLPATLEGLHAILPETFKTSLPGAYKLTYTLPDELGNVSLVVKTQQDYDNLLKKAQTKPIKVFIEREASNAVSSDYDIIQNKQKELVDKATEVLVPQVKKQSYFDYQPTQEDQIRKIVKDTLHEQLPSIISLVKEAVLREIRQAEQPAKIVEVPIQHEELLKVQPQRPEIYYEEAKNQEKPQFIVEQLDANEVVYKGEHEVEKTKPEVSKVEPVINQVKTFGFNLKNKIADLSGKAISAFDELSQKIEGDPYVVIEEGRYNKSVVDKADGLKDIFPEEERKSLLEFVKIYPRHATLEQLANAFLAKGQPQEVGDIAEN